MKTAKCLILKIARASKNCYCQDGEIVVVVDDEQMTKIKSHVEHADMFKNDEEINIKYMDLHAYMNPIPDESDWWMLTLNISPNERLTVIGESIKDGDMRIFETEKFDLSDFDTVLGL